MVVLLPSLIPKINRPFPEKLAETQEIIKHHIEEFQLEEQVIGWSGGKDSTVVVYLLRQFLPDIPIVFNNTGVEYPETRQFVQKMKDVWNLNLITVTYYKYSFWDCVKKWGYPKGKTNRKDHHMDKCCYYLKEVPMKLAIREYGWKCVYDGITAVENRNRMYRASSHGICYHHKQWNVCKVHPILWWTEQEVWNFINSQNIPYNSIYDKGVDRCGCMPCTAFKTWEIQLQKTAPQMYRKIMRDKGQELIS